MRIGRIDYDNLREPVAERIKKSLQYDEIAQELSELDGSQVPSSALFKKLSSDVDTIAVTGGAKGEKGDKGDKGDTFTFADLSQDEQESLRGDQGVMGDRGLPGEKGAKGDDGEKGDTGDQGIQGIQGLKGDKGEKGEKGDRGLIGLTGDTGATGERGLQGIKGDTGDQGVQGQPGIQGVKGEKGDGSVIRKTYDSVVELLADESNPELVVGDLLLVTSSLDDPDNGKVYIVKDTGIEFLSQLTGVKGDQGEQGEQGVAGIQGEKGSDGQQGIAGERGAPGLRGERGQDGEQGIQGETGATGDQGIQGLQGIKGDKGDKGDAFTYQQFTDDQLLLLKGERGEKGDRGERGTDGIQGLTGVTGEKGEKGDQGDKGERGNVGLQGIKGDAFRYIDFTASQLADLKGEKGDQGIQGFTGTQGLQGLKGDKGDQGIQGVRGVQGEPGKDATTKTNLSPEASYADYPEGVVTRRVITSASDPSYIYLANIIKELIGTDLIGVGNGNYFRIFMTTSKADAYANQNVYVSTNFSNNFYPVFELFRTYASSVWSAWKATVVENYGKVNPNGSIYGVYGAKYTDVLTNTTYIKKGAVNSATNSDWMQVSPQPLENGTVTVSQSTLLVSPIASKYGRIGNLSATFSSGSAARNADAYQLVGVMPASIRPTTFVTNRIGTNGNQYDIDIYANGNIFIIFRNATPANTNIVSQLTFLTSN